MIRKAVANDEPAIRECAEEAYSRYVSVIGRKPSPMLADFRSQIAGGNVYVALDEQEVIQGYIVFYPEDDHVLLESVAVLPRFAGQGIGKALIEFCEDAARQRGFSAVHLYTNVKMTDNLSIYPRLGYVEVGRGIDEGFHRVYFKKALA